MEAEVIKDVFELYSKGHNASQVAKIMKENKDSLYTIDNAIEDIKFAFDELLTAEYKYDYSKLPKDM